MPCWYLILFTAHNSAKDVSCINIIVLKTVFTLFCIELEMPAYHDGDRKIDDHFYDYYNYDFDNKYDFVIMMIIMICDYDDNDSYDNDDCNDYSSDQGHVNSDVVNDYCCSSGYNFNHYFDSYCYLYFL